MKTRKRSPYTPEQRASVGAAVSAGLKKSWAKRHAASDAKLIADVNAAERCWK